MEKLLNNSHFTVKAEAISDDGAEDEAESTSAEAMDAAASLVDASLEALKVDGKSTCNRENPDVESCDASKTSETRNVDSIKSAFNLDGLKNPFMDPTLASQLNAVFSHAESNGGFSSNGASCFGQTGISSNFANLSNALNGNTVDNSQVPTYKGHKMKREWRNVGWFTSDESMNEVRKREKVSKRKSVEQINGTKVFYRCNKWKRTNCNYRMFAMYYAPDKISLNESGEHDHTTPNLATPVKPTPRPSGAVFEATPSSSQQHVLDQLVLNATVNSSHLFDSFDQENVFETKNYGTNSPSRPNVNMHVQSFNENKEEFGENTYQLNDGQNISQLLQIAADMDLTFTFNSRRTSEYCFESNLPEMKGRMVVFSDFGGRVAVTERQDGLDRGCEQWKKADWRQFLWAVRGKCMNALKGI